METKVYKIDVNTLERVSDITDNQKSLIGEIKLNNSYNTFEDYIEINFYSLNNNLLLSDRNYKGYKIPKGSLTQKSTESSNIQINPVEDKKQYLFGNSDVKVVYNILRQVPYKGTEFYIKNISEDRTEVLIDLVNNETTETNSKIEEFINNQENNAYVNQYGLDFNNNQKYAAVNIQILENTNQGIALKFNSPIPDNIEVDSRTSIFEKISDSLAYEINTGIEEEENKVRYLKGPNFNIDVEKTADQETSTLNYDELFSISSLKSDSEIQSRLKNKSIRLGIDYSNFENFINFSSAEERLLNFKYKLGLIEQYDQAIEQIDSGSLQDDNKTRRTYERLKTGVISNFDHYEEHLFFKNEETSWPKSNTDKPYVNVGTESIEGQTWFEQEITKAVGYDNINSSKLISSIPGYISEDHRNEPYVTFINMIGHQFDNLWIYTKELSNKYNSDNRLDIGISKDLLETVLTNFGVKVFDSGNTVEDLFKYFVENEYDSGEENINTLIEAGEKVSEEDYKKEIYKRVYHNLPYLLKTKGTERGIKALINCFGIPSDTLTIKQFGDNEDQQLDRYGLNENQSGSIGKILIKEYEYVDDKRQLSTYTSTKKEEKNKDKELPRVEIGFNINQDVNTYIISQLEETFEIGNYIGDPVQDSETKYEKLGKELKRIVVDLNRFNTKDFIRLMKFYDNSFFRIVKEFIPGKITGNTGILIKQPVLNRNKIRDLAVTVENQIYEGSLDVVEISGKHGGVISKTTNYRQKVQTPTGIVEKKWKGPFSLNAGTDNDQYARSAEESKYDGELSGSIITITDGELNRDNPFKKIRYIDITYDLRFLSYIPEGICTIAYIDDPSVVRETDGSNISSIDLRDIFAGYNETFELSINGTLIPTVGTPGNVVSDYNLANLIPTENNYGTATIRIEKPGVDSPPPSEPEQIGCFLETDLQAVYCRITPNNTQINNFEPITEFGEYNLNPVVNGLNINTDTTFYEIEPNGSESIIADPSAYQVIEPTGRLDESILNIRIEDNIDNNCTVVVGLEFVICPITARYAVGEIRQIKLIPYTVPTTLFGGGRNPFSRAFVERVGGGLYTPIEFLLPDQINPILGEQGTTEVPEGTYVRYFIDVFKKLPGGLNNVFIGRQYFNFSGTDPNDITTTVFPKGDNTEADTRYTDYISIVGFSSSLWPDLTNFNPKFTNSTFRSQLTIAENYNDLVARNDELQIDIGNKSITRFEGRESLLPDGNLPRIQDLIDEGVENVTIRQGARLGENCEVLALNITRPILPVPTRDGDFLNGLSNVRTYVYERDFSNDKNSMESIYCNLALPTNTDYQGNVTLKYASLDNTLTEEVIDTTEFIEVSEILPIPDGAVVFVYYRDSFELNACTSNNGGQVNSSNAISYTTGVYRRSQNRIESIQNISLQCVICDLPGNPGGGGVIT